MKLVKTISSFLWHTHIYFFILGLIIWYPNSTNQLLGYLAMCITSSYTTILLLLLFRANLQKFEYVLPLVLYGVVGWLLIQYFYISGRTDLYWLGIYAAGAALFETIRHLYYHREFLENVHKFSLIGHLLASGFVLGIWFFVVDYLPHIAEDTLLLTLLWPYLCVGIIVQGVIDLEKNNWLATKTTKMFFAVIFSLAAFLLLIALFLSAIFHNLQ